MSQESMEWLNDNVLTGFTTDRAHWAKQAYAVTRLDGDGNEVTVPWFAQDDYTGGYEGPVPIDAVMDRLFNWQAISGPLFATVPCDISVADMVDDDGNATRKVALPSHQGIMRSDNDYVMGVFKSGYTIHQYDEWLLDNIAAIVDDELTIDSAGLLAGGSTAWVSISLPESVVSEAGFAIRPRILAYTSHSGKFATTYMRSVNAPVCDNSLTAEITDADKDLRLKVKHSTNSMGKIESARDALGIVYQQTEDSIAFFDALARWELDDKQFRQMLDIMEPMPEEKITDGKVTNKRGITLAENRRLDISTMYVKDDRAAPWRGTMLGALQAFNTFDQKERATKGVRWESMMMNTLSGGVDKFDRDVLKVGAEVTGRELAVV